MYNITDSFTLTGTKPAFRLVVGLADFFTSTLSWNLHAWLVCTDQLHQHFELLRILATLITMHNLLQAIKWSNQYV